ncbi:MAG: hypothetical protein RBT75_09550 [Anaerolineae bacterium]|nr:hypothetical protein [Anaerolineae bacterium]
MRFKTGAKISGAPTGRSEKMIFGGGALPHRQKSIKERRLYDGSLAFTPKLKRTRMHQIPMFNSLLTHTKILSQNVFSEFGQD